MDWIILTVVAALVLGFTYWQDRHACRVCRGRGWLEPIGFEPAQRCPACAGDGRAPGAAVARQTGDGVDWPARVRPMLVGPWSEPTPEQVTYYIGMDGQRVCGACDGAGVRSHRVYTHKLEPCPSCEYVRAGLGTFRGRWDGGVMRS